MDANNNLTVGSGSAGAPPYGRPAGAPRPNARRWVNWGLALATVPGAALVMLFALGAVMSTDGCSPQSCPNLGHGGINLGVAFYGAPAVAVLVIIVSVFTAKRRWGIAIPLCGWALLIADVGLMALSVAG